MNEDSSKILEIISLEDLQSMSFEEKEFIGAGTAKPLPDVALSTDTDSENAVEITTDTSLADISDISDSEVHSSLFERLHSTMQSATFLGSPDEYLELLKKSEETGYSVGALLDFPDLLKGIKDDVFVSKIDGDELQKLVNDAPAIASNIASSVERAVISADDIPALTQWGQRVGMFNFGTVSDEQSASTWNKFLDKTKNATVDTAKQAWHNYNYRFAMTEYMNLVGQELESGALGGTFNVPRVYDDILLALKFSLTGEAGNLTARQFRMKQFEEMLDYHGSRMKQEDVNWVQKNLYATAGHFGQRTSWFIEKSNWALWGLVAAGAVISLSGVGAPVGGTLMAAGATGLGTTGAFALGAASQMGKVGAFNSMRYGEFAGNYMSGMNETDLDGNKLDEDTVLKAAWFTAWPQAISEYIQYNLLWEVMPMNWKPTSWFNRGLSETAKTFIPKPAWQQMAGTIGSVSFNLANQMAQEVYQGAMWDIVERQLKIASGQPFEPQTAKEVFADSLQEGKEAFYSFFLTSMVGMGGQLFYDYQNIKQANAERAKWLAVADMQENTKTGQRDKTAIADDVQAISDSTTGRFAYVPRRQFIKYFQDAGLDPQEAAEELHVSDQLNLYLNEMGEGETDMEDIAIPAHVYAEKIAMTEHRDGLIDHTKSHVDGITPAEARVAAAEVAEQLVQVKADVESQMGLGAELFNMARLSLVDAQPDIDPRVADDQAMTMVKNAITLSARISNTSPQEILSRVTIKSAEKAKISDIKSSFRGKDTKTKVTSAESYRGELRFNLLDGRATINLFQNADPTTLIHEFSGHFYTETLLHAERNGMLNVLGQNDLNVLRNWVGADLTAESFTEEQSEKIARGVEAYFMEGKSPSLELTNVFERMRKLFLQVYNDIRMLDVELSDEVRAVFDSWLAAGDELEHLRHLESFEALVNSAEKLGITEEQTSDLLKAMSDSMRYENSQINKDVITPILNRVKELQAKRAEYVKQANQVIDNTPVYRARRLMFGVTEQYKPHKSEIVDTFTNVDEALKVFKGAYTVKEENAVSLTTIAEMAGYMGDDAVYDMYEDLKTYPKKSEAIARFLRNAIDRDIQQGMFGDVFSSIIADAHHNDARMMSLALEQVLTSNSRDDWAESATHIVASVKSYAKRALLDRNVEDINPRKFMTAEQNYAKAYDRAILDGDTDLAVRYKELQLINHALAREAFDMAKKITTARRLVKKYATRGRNTFGLDSTILKTIDNTIQSFTEQYSTADTADTVRHLMSDVATNMEVVEKNTKEIGEVLEDVMKDIVPKMTLSDFLTMHETLSTLDTSGKQKMAETQEMRDIKFQARKLKMINHIDSVKGFKGRDKRRKKVNLNYLDKTKEFGRAILNEHMNIDYLCKVLDDGDTGVFRENIYQPIEDGYNHMMSLNHEVTKKFEDSKAYKLFKESSPYKKRVSVDLVIDGKARTQSLNTNNLYQIALLFGNAEGRQRLESSYGLTESAVIQLLNTLSDAELESVADLWAVNETFFGEANELHKRVFKKEMLKVEALPYKVRNITLDGGYAPIYYDRVLSSNVKMGDDFHSYEANPMLSGYLTIAANYTQERVRLAPKGAVVSLNAIESMIKHINAVTKDLGMQEAIEEVQRFTNDTDVRNAIAKVIGESGANQFNPWLKFVKQGGELPVAGIDKVFRHIRKAGTVAGLGAKYSPAVSQIWGFSSAAVMLGDGNPVIGGAMVLEAISNYYLTTQSNRAEMKQFIHESSVFMKFRRETLDRDLRTLLNVHTVGGKVDQIRSAAFQFIGLMDSTVTLPVWQQAYNMKVFEHGHDFAAAYADQVIRQTNNVGRVIDLAAVQRGGELKKMTTMFYSYLGTLNRMYQYEIGKSIRDRDKSRAVSFFMWALIVPTVLNIVTKEGLPEPERDPNEPYWVTVSKAMGKKTAKETTLYSMAPWVGIRDIASYFSGFGYDLSPATSGARKQLARINNTYKLMTQEGQLKTEDYMKIADNVFSTGEFFYAMPTTEVRRRLGYIISWANDENKEFDVRSYLFNKRQDKKKKRRR